MKLKILSYNIHKGLTIWNRDNILARMKTALRETDADILFLQEVIGNHSAKKFFISGEETRIQFEYLADSVWPHFAYGKNAIYSEGHHGNAILSKFPIVEWENFQISDHDHEVRGLLKAKIHIQELNQNIVLANTHLDLTQKGRDNQVHELIKHLKEESELPWFLVGDFNDWNKKISPRLEKKLKIVEAFKELKGKYPLTFPSFLPVLSLDRVFLHKLRPLKAEALINATWKGLSDHLPLYVEAELPG